MTKHSEVVAKIARLVSEDRQRVIDNLKKQLDDLRREGYALSDEYRDQLPYEVLGFLRTLGG